MASFTTTTTTTTTTTDDAAHHYRFYSTVALRRLQLCSCVVDPDSSGVDEGVDEVGEQGEAHRRGAPLAGTANSSLVETPSGSPATSCGRV